jgi:superfamily II DNA or RNA helicase
LFPTQYICGLTATPVSSSFNLNKTYAHIVSIEGGTPRLIEQGYLVPSIDIGQPEFLDLKMQCGDFSMESVRSAFTKHSLDEKFMRLWRMHAKDRQTIVFCIDIEHATRMARYYNDIGISNCIIHSKIDEDEREKNLKFYNNGDVQILINVDVASKGFDSPITSCVGFHRSTASMARWYQAIGRGGRLYEGKKNFITIDTGNNLPRFGSFNDFVDWQHIFKHPELDIKKQKKKPATRSNQF